MSPNSVLTNILSIAAVAGLAIWLALEHQARLRLAEEHRALEQQLNQMTGRIANSAQGSSLAGRETASQSLPAEQSRELLRLRGEVGILRQQARELEAVRAENRQARAANAPGAPATADYWPRDSWAFAGYASPDAALQSSLWAANSGDVKALLASATGEVRKQMESQYGGKPETEASIRAMDDVMSLKSVRVLNREVQSDDTVVLTTVFEGRTDTQTGKLVLKKIGNEWKLYSADQ